MEPYEDNDTDQVAVVGIDGQKKTYIQDLNKHRTSKATGPGLSHKPLSRFEPAFLIPAGVAEPCETINEDITFYEILLATVDLNAVAPCSVPLHRSIDSSE